MAALTTKSEICNIALSKLGNRGTVENIDTPTKASEKTFAKWYDIVRQLALKEQKPNFAQERRIVGQDLTKTPPFGYSFAFEYPQDCLALLGIGEQTLKRNNYSVENNAIFINDDFGEEYVDNGLPIRFIKDVTDVSKFSAEFVLVFASMLADKVCYEITEDDTKKQIVQTDMKSEKASASALSGQENRPIKINNSRFKAARRVWQPNFNDKR